MKRIVSAALAVLAVGSLGALAYAQVTLPTVAQVNSTDLFNDVVNGFPTSQQKFATSLQLRSFALAQNSQHLTAPTLTTSGSTCGGSTATVSGTDTSGQVAEGTSASTSCVITFANAYTTAPECFVSIDNVADTSLKCATSTTALTITKSSAASEKINYLLVGLAGG